MVYVNIQGKRLMHCDAKNLKHIHQQIFNATNLASDQFYLLQNGKTITQDNYSNDSTADINVQLRIPGGKGGFGSMLRAIGAQIEKTTNREACRDLSGRRLRDINEEKRLKAWLEKQKDREAEAEEKKKKKVAKLLHVPKHEFKDAQYEEARTNLTEKVNDAVEEGFQNEIEKQNNEKPNLKRKAEPVAKAKSAKGALWLGADIDGSSCSSSSEDSETEDGPSTSKKIVKQ
ncbi:splicing regulator SDE2 [Episyrphus balteatus]|uniref:splicing regulator SDE2 n=1 Tax=Episyrphus balteatus TaxID=286459 RepID=UPI002485D324|nr:splicing regulator SDE2 [Episyrphus balteatus]